MEKKTISDVISKIKTNNTELARLKNEILETKAVLATTFKNIEKGHPNYQQKKWSMKSLVNSTDYDLKLSLLI
jgi:uncharacterized protein involved in exopolysaccharide biosynthesis